MSDQTATARVLNAVRHAGGDGILTAHVAGDTLIVRQRAEVILDALAAHGLVAHGKANPDRWFALPPGDRDAELIVLAHAEANVTAARESQR